MSTSRASTAETSNDRKRKKDPEIRMSNNQEKHFKEGDTSSLPVPGPPFNSLEQIMIGAMQPPVSKDEILDYLDRNPSWYYLFGELIRLEQKDKEKKNEGLKTPAPAKKAIPGDDSFTNATEKIIQKNMNTIRLCPPQTGLPTWIDDFVEDNEPNEYNPKTSWLTQELKERINLPAKLSCNQKNHLLPPPPNRPNKNATITAIEVHFRGQPEPSRIYDWSAGDYIANEAYDPNIHFKKICGWTFFYDDNMQIPIGHTKDASFEAAPGGNNFLIPICRHTAKIELEKGEHIIAIDTGRSLGESSDLIDFKFFAFYTTNGRWLIAEDGKTTHPGHRRPRCNSQHETMPIAKVKAPEGTVFQFFEGENDDNGSTLRKIKNPITFVSILDVNACNDRVGMPAIAPLYVKCEETLLDHYQKKKVTTRHKAYKDFKDFDTKHCEECKKMSQSFADCLNTSSEAKVIRLLNHLIKFSITKLEEKRDVLLQHAKEAYAPVYEASKLRIEQHKKAVLEEQAQIYEDHKSFLKKSNFLKGFCDDDGVFGAEQQLCFRCRKAYQPKKLPFLKRCQAEGCSSAFWNCGCAIKICRDRCKGIYCGNHCRHMENPHAQWSY